MIKSKKSTAAIFMYCVIALTAVCSAVCFALYYGRPLKNDAVLRTGVVSFMIMYHLWLRIIMGNISKLFAINYKCRWLNESAFERRLYKFLRVKKWKDKVPTYNPELFSLKKHSLETVANAMAKSEIDHWINEVISLSSLLFVFVWGEPWTFLITAVAAMLFDAQFIVVQRYNRPRLVKLIKMQEARAARI